MLEDSELYAMKAIILMIDNQFDIAEVVLKLGLNIKHDSFNLVYNLCYLYYIKLNKKNV